MECRVVPRGAQRSTPPRTRSADCIAGFHHGGPVVSMAEAALNAMAAAELTENGFTVLTHDIGTQTPAGAAEALATAVLTRLEDQADGA